MSEPSSVECDYGGADLVVVMDGFGDWTPFAAFYDGSEAVRLREMLSADAEAVCATGPYYDGQQAVRDGEPSEPPEGLESIYIVFADDEVLGLCDVEMAAREVQCEQGGLRTSVPIYQTAEAVVEDRPAAVGQFIASKMTAEDLLEAIR